ncbi:ion-transporting P-type ATPase [Blattamonas nauphoetae]|uniref:Ion-transporting P-type ATPase n=1 Tax=Blattamonas nauphoetae TaxID=2049346 RepID=A0ABQ9XD40_9EUKA|nr:ion-transporting P-type ATPase [Blattamonas nauphoetae]
MVPIINHFLSIIPPLDSSSTIHDNACGTGLVTQTIIANMELVKSQDDSPSKLTFQCTDLSPDMIDKLSTKIQKFGWTNVTATVMDASQLTFDDETFTHTFTNFGIFFLPDPIPGIRHIFRTLKHGGISITTTWERVGYLPAMRKADQLTRPDLPSIADTLGDKWTQESYVRSVFEEGGFSGSQGIVTFDRCETTLQATSYEGHPLTFWTLYGYSVKGWTEDDKKKWLSIFVEELSKSDDCYVDSSGTCHVRMFALIEGIVITCVILINAGIGFIQDFKTGKDSEALTKMLSQSAVVIRDGITDTVQSTELVIGDIVQLQGGDKIPADCRLIEVANFHSEESALTGETTSNPKSISVSKLHCPLGERKNMVYSGTYASQGTALAIVCATGTSTQIGKIHSMVSSVKEEKSPLIKQINKFSTIITILTVFLIGIAFAVVYFMNFRRIQWQEALIYGASIGVAAIPEGLPAIISLTLAIGMQRLAKKKALMKTMHSVETLGAVSVICSDKTGTLTTNQMTVKAILTAPAKYQVSGTGYNPADGEVMDADGDLRLIEAALVSELSAQRSRGPKKESPKIGSVAPAGLDAPTQKKPLIQTEEVRAAVDTQRIAEKNGQHQQNQDLSMNGLTDTESPTSQNFNHPSNTHKHIHRNNPNGPAIYHHPDLIKALCRCSLLCNDSILKQDAVGQWSIQGDTTEGALIPFSIKAGVSAENIQNSCNRIAFIPFESEYGFMVSTNRCPKDSCDILSEVSEIGDTNDYIFLKGAPEKILSLCTKEMTIDNSNHLTAQPLRIDWWKEETEKVAAIGLRTIALCQRLAPTDRSNQDNSLQTQISFDEVNEGGFTLLGVVGIFDPPRTESKRAIDQCRSANIKVVMITGDHAKTAAAIGGLLGLDPSTVKTSHDLARMTDAELDLCVDGCEIFARATPADKLRIVKSFQRTNHIVAMTGDGVNDSPALKQAHVGIAMGINGTEVAKEASKMILLDDNFATIVTAVKQGRIVYNSLKRSITYILPTGCAEVLTLFVSSFISHVPPINALQILWVNTITSITLSSLIPFQRGEHDVLNVPPRNTKKGLLTITVLIRTLLAGGTIAAFIIFYFYLNVDRRDPVPSEVRRYSATSVNMIVFAEICFLYNTVYLKESSFTPRVFVDIGLVSTVAIVVLLLCQVGLTYIPRVNSIFGMAWMKWYDWLFVLLCGVSTFVVIEIEKAVHRCRHWTRMRHLKRRAIASHTPHIFIPTLSSTSRPPTRTTSAVESFSDTDDLITTETCSDVERDVGCDFEKRRRGRSGEIRDDPAVGIGFASYRNHSDQTSSGVVTPSVTRSAVHPVS